MCYNCLKNKDGAKNMEHIEFENVNIPVAVAAKALNSDCQTVRYLLQQGMVDWGIAYKHKKSKRYSYMIYAKKFYEATGFVYKKE